MINISDPSVDPKLLFESFCWWFLKQFNFGVDGRLKKGEVGGEGVNFDYFVRYIGVWSKSGVGPPVVREWDEALGGGRVLVECWVQLGYLRVEGDGVWFLEFRPRCGTDIKSSGGVV